MTDYLLDSGDDLQMANGDFVKGYSNKQHQRALLLGQKNDYKQSPLCTVGLIGYENDDNPSEMLREIRLRFNADGMKVTQLGTVNGKLIIVADYAS